MKHLEFFKIVKNQLEEQFKEEERNIQRAAEYMAQSLQKERLIHIFGCGHSQMFAMEAFYRAGGLVQVNALLIPHLALFPKAKLSTIQERVEGFSSHYLELEDTSSDDTMIIVSMSGRNAAVIDMAQAAKAIGMKVVVLTSMNFSRAVSSRHSSGKMLHELADVIIDIKCVEGDASLQMEEVPYKFVGTSTILGMTVIDAMIARSIELSVDDGYVPPIYVSSNLDEGDDINKEHIKKYKNLISCL